MSLRGLTVLGMNHKTANVAVREKLAFTPDDTVAAIAQLKAREGIQEAVLVSTCNRTELYLNAKSIKPVIEFLGQSGLGGDKELLLGHSYRMYGHAAVSHLMRVTSGLDSMVLGENEILGQVKRAYELSHQANAVGKKLSKLFQHSFKVAKIVRTNTGIAKSPVSVASMACKLAKQLFSELKDKTVLIVGAGEMSKLILTHLIGFQVGRVIIANRNIERAIVELRVPGDIDVDYIELKDIPDYLMHADIVVSSTASPLPILGKGLFETAIKKRKYKPMFVIDLAVPRDVEPEVANVRDIYLYSLDDLNAFVTKNQETRTGAIECADEIIKHASTEYIDWFLQQKNVDVIKEYRAKTLGLKEEAIMQAFRKLERGMAPEYVILDMAHGLVNKIMHSPIVKMRQYRQAKEQNIVAICKEIFDLTNKK